MSGEDRERKPPRDRRKLEEIFGEVLPDTTSDEREPERPPHDEDAWYRENRPPHHGG
ncbi:hypothetical protein GCM10017786_37790 [Amycolatopsis deserti]|uniref:Antitoxin VapB n=1 Tax=Amycolatopsis deserti TaxID=185696 RepID=A0ABQ3J1L5_9PSEU|nr:hypothetical protein [Amycolatopsis deserti]GHF01224.1 hypothetical protein GCM10017786_37790 [Amycolatopsis deserti]